MRVLAGVDRPSKREIRPKLRAVIACLDGFDGSEAISSRELPNMLNAG
jgi:hypothetical protein